MIGELEIDFSMKAMILVKKVIFFRI